MFHPKKVTRILSFVVAIGFFAACEYYNPVAMVEPGPGPKDPKTETAPDGTVGGNCLAAEPRCAGHLVCNAETGKCEAAAPTDPSGDTVTPTIPAGTDGGSCLDGDRCYNGLECKEGKCTRPEAGAPDTDPPVNVGKKDGPCDVGNRCDEGLTCVNGVCTVPETGAGDPPPQDDGAKTPAKKAKSKGPGKVLRRQPTTPAALMCGENQKEENGSCVCISGDYLPAAPAPDGTHRCARGITDIRLLFQTADITYAGTNPAGGGAVTNGSFLFTLCAKAEDLDVNIYPENYNDPDNPPTCLQRLFSDKGPDKITLDQGKFDSINLTDASRNIRGKSLADLRYPDDFQYFKITTDRSGDDWLLAGVEVSVKLAGDGDTWTTIYKNPCLNRWIDDKHSSLHSIQNDVAYCTYLETAMAQYASTDERSVVIDIGLKEYPSNPVAGWFDANKKDQDFGASVTTLETGSGGTRLAESRLSWEPYDNFLGGKKTSYGFTLPGGVAYLNTTNAIDLRVTSKDAWKVHRVAVASFLPGDPDFINDRKCQKVDSYPEGDTKASNPATGQWMSTEEEDPPAIEKMPLSLSYSTCPSLCTIEWGTTCPDADGGALDPSLFFGRM